MVAIFHLHTTSSFFHFKVLRHIIYLRNLNFMFTYQIRGLTKITFFTYVYMFFSLITQRVIYINFLYIFPDYHKIK